MQVAQVHSSSTGPKWIEGAHIYPRSTYPKLASVPFCIVPLCHWAHGKLDKDPLGNTREPNERIEWLRAFVHEDWSETLDIWLDRLEKVFKEAYDV